MIYEKGRCHFSGNQVCFLQDKWVTAPGRAGGLRQEDCLSSVCQGDGFKGTGLLTMLPIQGNLELGV